MNQDILYRQLHRIIKNVRFSERTVFLMGSASNVRLVQKYLACYHLKAYAVLDNNPALEGTYVGGIRTYLTTKALTPVNERALILVFSPGYWKEMKEQLEELGYKENIHFYILKDFRRMTENTWNFIMAMRGVRKGYRIYRRIRETYGDDTFIFLERGATGDVFLNGLYLEPYARAKGITSYVIVGDAKGISRIAPLFGAENVMQLSFQEAEALQHAYSFLKLEGMKDVFTWQWSLYFNRCRIRMTERFHFQDTYTYHLYEGLVTKEKWKLPGFVGLDNDLVNKYKKMGILKDRTIILAPFAYSVKNLPDYFWSKLAVLLSQKGYKIMVNINPGSEMNPFPEIEAVQFPFAEIEAILTYAGHFLALRSGLCDIAALVKCHQVILYPEKMQPANYSMHRSDVEFSGFCNMEFDSGHITEISSPLIKDIVNDRVDNRTPWEICSLYDELNHKILNEFSVISTGVCDEAVGAGAEEII